MREPDGSERAARREEVQPAMHRSEPQRARAASLPADVRGRAMRGAVHGISTVEKLNRMWNTEISSHTSAATIMRVCSQHATQFTMVNAVTALHRIAAASDGVAAL